jgi:hypothetical protein
VRFIFRATARKSVGVCRATRDKTSSQEKRSKLQVKLACVRTKGNQSCGDSLESSRSLGARELEIRAVAINSFAAQLAHHQSTHSAFIKIRPRRTQSPTKNALHHVSLYRAHAATLSHSDVTDAMLSPMRHPPPVKISARAGECRGVGRGSYLLRSIAGLGWGNTDTEM